MRVSHLPGRSSDDPSLYDEASGVGEPRGLPADSGNAEGIGGDVCVLRGHAEAAGGDGGGSVRV